MNNTISINGKIVAYENGMTLKSIAGTYKNDRKGTIVLAILNGGKT
jgi:hypothetical protein